MNLENIRGTVNFESDAFRYKWLFSILGQRSFVSCWNSHSVRQNKWQHFQWPVPWFALLSVLGISGTGRRAQAVEGKILETHWLNRCVCTQVACCAKADLWFSRFNRESVTRKPERMSLAIPTWKILWKLLGTSGDLMGTAQKSVCEEFNSRFKKKMRKQSFVLFS